MIDNIVNENLALNHAEVINQNNNNHENKSDAEDDKKNYDGLCINSKILASMAHKQEEYQAKMLKLSEMQSKQQTSILNTLKTFLFNSLNNNNSTLKQINNLNASNDNNPKFISNINFNHLTLQKSHILTHEKDPKEPSFLEDDNLSDILNSPEENMLEFDIELSSKSPKRKCNNDERRKSKIQNIKSSTPTASKNNKSIIKDSDENEDPILIYPSHKIKIHPNYENSLIKNKKLWQAPIILKIQNLP